MKKLIVITLMGLLTGCASNQVKSLDTEMTVKGSSNDGSVGIKDGVVIIEKEEYADNALRVLEWQNNLQEDKVISAWGALKACREQLADVRLGGKGTVTALPEIDSLKPVSEIKEEFGLTKNGDLKFVEKQEFLKKMESEKHYSETLTTMLKTINSSNDTCELSLVGPRVAKGLPGHRYGSESLDHELTNRAPASIDGMRMSIKKVQESSIDNDQ